MPLVTASADDRTFLAEALAEAEQSFAAGGIPVGAVLVREGKIIARGHNRSQQTNDPTSHGEVEAIRDACRKGLRPRLPNRDAAIPPRSKSIPAGPRGRPWP